MQLDEILHFTLYHIAQILTSFLTSEKVAAQIISSKIEAQTVSLHALVTANWQLGWKKKVLYGD